MSIENCKCKQHSCETPRRFTQMVKFDSGENNKTEIIHDQRLQFNKDRKGVIFERVTIYQSILDCPTRLSGHNIANK